MEHLLLKEQYITTEKELKEELNNYLAAVKDKKINKLLSVHSDEFYGQYLKLVSDFSLLVENTRLLNDLEPMWYYCCEIDDTGASLHLCHVDRLEVDENEIIDCLSIDEDFELVKVNARLLTVEEYAKIYGVTVGTVRQWIRRGKIRTAIKAGSEWRIPELTELHGRGYAEGRYFCEENIENIPAEYSFLNLCCQINIKQAGCDTFNVICAYRDSEEERCIKMSTKEREKFELFLITNDRVRAYKERFKEIEILNAIYN